MLYTHIYIFLLYFYVPAGSRNSVVSLAVGIPLAVILCIIIIIFFSIGGRSYNRRRLRRSRTAPVMSVHPPPEAIVQTIPVYPTPVGSYSNTGVQQFKGDCPPPYTPPTTMSSSTQWTAVCTKNTRLSEYSKFGRVTFLVYI